MLLLLPIDIFVNESVCSAVRVKEYLEQFGLVSKVPEQLSTGICVLGLHVLEEKRKMRWCCGSEILAVPDSTHVQFFGTSVHVCYKNYLKSLLKHFMMYIILMRYVIFSTICESRKIFHSLCQLHPALKFTCKFQNNDCLRFLHVQVEHTKFIIDKFN